MTKPKSKTGLQRDLRNARGLIESQSGQINSMMIKMAELRARFDVLTPKVLAGEIEVARLQGYIDRVLDEGRTGSQIGPRGPLDKIRESVISGDASLDEMSNDEIERLTGRDDHT